MPKRTQKKKKTAPLTRAERLAQRSSKVPIFIILGYCVGGALHVVVVEKLGKVLELDGLYYNIVYSSIIVYRSGI